MKEESCYLTSSHELRVGCWSEFGLLRANVSRKRIFLLELNYSLIFSVLIYLPKVFFLDLNEEGWLDRFIFGSGMKGLSD